MNSDDKCLPLIDALEWYLNSLSVEVRFKELTEPFLTFGFVFSFFLASLSLKIEFASTLRFCLLFGSEIGLSLVSFVLVELKLASSHMVAKGALLKPVFTFDAA